MSKKNKKTQHQPIASIKEFLQMNGNWYRFYEKYHHVGFSKHPEKYVKYTPAEVSSQLDSYFDAAA